MTEVNVGGETQAGLVVEEDGDQSPDLPSQSYEHKETYRVTNGLGISPLFSAFTIILISNTGTYFDTNGCQ